MKYASIESQIKLTVLNIVMYVLWKLKGYSNVRNGLPRKHKTFVSHLYKVGPTSKTLGRRCTNGIQMFCVSWLVALSALFEYLFYKSTTTRNSAGIVCILTSDYDVKRRFPPWKGYEANQMRRATATVGYRPPVGPLFPLSVSCGPGPTGDN